MKCSSCFDIVQLFSSLTSGQGSPIRKFSGLYIFISEKKNEAGLSHLIVLSLLICKMIDNSQNPSHFNVLWKYLLSSGEHLQLLLLSQYKSLDVFIPTGKTLQIEED